MDSVNNGGIPSGSAALKGMPREGLRPVGNCDVLIIEDEEIMSALIERYLKNAHQELDLPHSLKVSTTPEALQLFEEDLSNVKVAIVDILLPRVTGVDLIRHFRKKYPHMGLVPISGMATDPMKRSLKELIPPGMADLLPKPLRKEDFYTALEKALQYHQRPQGDLMPAQEAGEDLYTVAKAKPNTDIAVVRRRLVRPKGEA